MEADEGTATKGLFDGIEKWSRPARKWLWSNRGKVAVAAAVVATAAAVYYTTKAQQPSHAAGGVAVINAIPRPFPTQFAPPFVLGPKGLVGC